MSDRVGRSDSFLPSPTSLFELIELCAQPGDLVL